MARSNEEKAAPVSGQMRLMNPTHHPLTVKARIGKKLMRLDVAPMQRADVGQDFVSAVYEHPGAKRAFDELVPADSAEAIAAKVDAERERKAAVASGSEDQGPIDMPVATPREYNPTIIGGVQAMNAIRAEPNPFTGA